MGIRSVAERVRALRKNKKWSQDELAAAAGVHRNTIATLETVAIGDMGVETLRAIARALDVPVSALADEESPGRGVA